MKSALSILFHVSWLGFVFVFCHGFLGDSEFIKFPHIAHGQTQLLSSSSADYRTLAGCKIQNPC